MSRFEVKKLDFETMDQSLQSFYDNCLSENIINNTSAKVMKVGQFENEAWWGVFAGEKLISVSGCHKSTNFGDDYWRLLFRSATLTAYRGLAGPISRDLKHDFCWGLLLEEQKKFAKKHNAKVLFFSTNARGDGLPGSRKVNDYVAKVLVPLKKVKLLHGEIEFYSCHQNIWEIL